MTTEPFTYRDHTIVECAWLVVSGPQLAPAHRFIVVEHANGACLEQRSGQYLSLMYAMREVDRCAPPVPPSALSADAVRLMTGVRS